MISLLKKKNSFPFIALILFLAILIVFNSCSNDDKSKIDLRDNEQISEITSPMVIKDSKDDYPEMEKRRLIRVLVSYNSTNYFITSDAKQKGLEYELMNNFESFLNEKVTKSDQEIDIIFQSVPFNSLIPFLLEGKGDIAAAGLTITPERKQFVAFTKPYINNVSEIVVKSEDATPIEDIYDLSGKPVHVVKEAAM